MSDTNTDYILKYFFKIQTTKQSLQNIAKRTSFLYQKALAYRRKSHPMRTWHSSSFRILLVLLYSLPHFSTSILFLNIYSSIKELQGNFYGTKFAAHLRRILVILYRTVDNTDISSFLGEGDRQNTTAHLQNFALSSYIYY